jgi:hypothetical protein
MDAPRGVACWFGLVACLVAQSPSPATLPDDIRAALFALPRHERVATGITVTACDDATSAPLPRASVFVIEPRRGAEAAPRVPRIGFDLERQLLVVPLLAGTRYETDERGTVVVPSSPRAAIYVVTPTGSGLSVAGGGAGRASDTAPPTAI